MLNRQPEIDPSHRSVQGPLRGLGLLLATAGLIMTAVGLVSFFRAFGTFQPPRYFWCAVVGLPLLGLGLALTKVGYLGSISRYMAGEVVPVQKDSFNYLAEGTAPGVETIARSAAQGIARGTPRAGEVRCPHCEAPNNAANRFCGQCGGSLEATNCAACGRRNEPGANFCSQCGAGLRGDGPRTHHAPE